MDVIQAIHTRQSIGKVAPDPLPRALVEKLLLAGAQAPNYHKVRPWRFVVLTGAARERLGEVMADSQRQKQPNLPAEAYEKTRRLPLRAPLIIAVGVDKPTDPKVIEIENVAAVAAACQNILLAAHAEGLGAIWRTGEWAYDPQVKRFLGFDADQHLLGFLYIGYLENQPSPPQRPSHEDRTVWMD